MCGSGQRLTRTPQLIAVEVELDHVPVLRADAIPFRDARRRARIFFVPPITARPRIAIRGCEQLDQRFELVLRNCRSGRPFACDTVAAARERARRVRASVWRAHARGQLHARAPVFNHLEVCLQPARTPSRSRTGLALSCFAAGPARVIQGAAGGPATPQMLSTPSSAASVPRSV